MAEENDLSNLNKKERSKYLKNLYQSKESKEKRNRMLVFGAIGLGIILAITGLVLLANSRSTSKLPEVGTKVDPMPAPNTATHIEVGALHVPYSTNPPTSGPHYNAPGYGPIACKFYDQEIYDESAVHNLEHGSVWVTWKDKNDTTLAKQIKDVVQNYAKVLASPRSRDDSKIAVVAWGWILKTDNFDATKIKNFINLHKDQGPESQAGCGGDPVYLK